MDCCGDSVVKNLPANAGDSGSIPRSGRSPGEANSNPLHRQSSLAGLSFSSVAQSCLTLCDPVDCSMPGLPVHHQLPEFTQTHVRWVGDAIQPSHPLSSPSPPFNLAQHQGLFKWVSSSHHVARVLEFQLQHQHWSVGVPKSWNDWVTEYARPRKHIGHLPTWGAAHLPVSYLFAFSHCPWGSLDKNNGVFCQSILQWTMFCHYSPLWPTCLFFLMFINTKTILHWGIAN